MSLNMLQLEPDLAALVRFLVSQGQHHWADQDLGYGTHAWLAATFGELAPRPFRLFRDRSARRPPKLLAYTSHSLQELADYAITFAEPAAQAVCDPRTGLQLAALPAAWPTGHRYGFEVLACPTARKSRSGQEKDVFLQRADHAEPGTTLDRAQVYGEWLQSQTRLAVALESVSLDGFSLSGQLRRRQPTASRDRTERHLVRPRALLRGVLRVTDSDAFAALLARGIGRHRSFGYGMLLLRPAP